MEQTNHYDSEQDPFWENDWSPNLAHTGVPSVPGTLLPTVLARLGLNHAPFSGEPSIDELVTALNDPAWQVRTAAIQALGSLDEHVPIEPLLAALDDEDLSVRAAAIWAIGSLDEQAPVDRLLTALHDSEWLVREIAVMMLGTLGERVPAEPLLTALRALALANGAHTPANSGDLAGAKAFRQAVINAVQGTSWAGITGQQAFDSNGDTTNKVISIYQLAAVSGKPDWKYLTAAMPS